LDSAHAPRARRTAYEWLLQANPSAKQRLLPQLLNDPSVEMRRDAVALLIQQGLELKIAGKGKASETLFQQAMAAARDQDQVKILAVELKELGKPVDLSRHFGFLPKWNLIAPFDNTDGKGYAASYPPEKSANPRIVHQGKDDPVRWIAHETEDEYGLVLLNKALDNHKGSVAYAHTKFTSKKGGPAEVRLGCGTSWKLWINGKFAFGRDEYHRGFKMDQYVVPVLLKPGENEILLKVCQNEQTEDWAQKWQFQLRVCDASGTGLLSADR
ncbi:MAG: hypothetical protein N2C14_11345, partial [Planctomycetales bacterium]